MADYYEWIKALHIIFIISWMAGMLYLPRLFVYHSGVSKESEADQLFQKMEYRLITYIITPSMVLSITFGVLSAYIYGFLALGLWFHIKMLGVALLVSMYFYFIKCHIDFRKGDNKRSSKFYRIINEIPAVIMVIAVIMVVVKPFE